MDPRAYGLLIEAIQHRLFTDHTTLVAIVRALKERRNADATGHLLSINKFKSSLEYEIAQAIRSFGDQAVIPILQGLEDENPGVRRVAVDAAASEGNHWAIQPLLLALTRMRGIDAAIGVTPSRNKSNLLWPNKLAAIDPAWATTPEAQSTIPDLISMLADSHLDSRSRQPALLLDMINPGWTRLPEATNTIKQLAVLAGSTLVDVRCKALHALEEIDDAWRSRGEAHDAMPCLVETLQERGHYAYWCENIDLLGSINTHWKMTVDLEPILSFLVTELWDSIHGPFAGEALASLDRAWAEGPLGENLAKTLHEDATGKHAQREAVFRVMGNSKARGFLPDLLAALNQHHDDVSLVATVCESMGRVGDPSCVKILASLLTETPSESVKAACARALGFIGGQDARDFLERTLSYSWKTTDLTCHYFKALGQIGYESSIRRMLLLYKENGQVGITDFPIPAFPRRALGDVLVEMGPVALTAILDFVEEVHAEELYRLPLDIFLDVLTQFLERSSSGIPDHALHRIVRLPELWRVASLGHTKGYFDVVDEIRTESLDSSRLRDLATRELAARQRTSIDDGC